MKNCILGLFGNLSGVILVAYAVASSVPKHTTKAAHKTNLSKLRRVKNKNKQQVRELDIEL